MTNIGTHTFSHVSPDPQSGERRFASEHNDRGTPGAAAPLDLTWPTRWPAALYRGNIGAKCQVRAFTAGGARLKMPQPPAKGTLVSLKFPFTVYLRGTVISSEGDTLELAFDEEARRSARLVEDVLLSHDAALRATAA